MHLIITIYDPVDDARRLGEEVDLHGGVHVSQEVLVDCDEELDVAVVVDRAPNGAELAVDVREVALLLEELHHDEVGEGLALLHVHVELQ